MRRKVLIFALLLLSFPAFSAALADTVYTQPYAAGNALTSTSGAFVAYDNFTAPSTSTITEVEWFGIQLANTPTFTLSFYSSTNGSPGLLLSSTLLGDAHRTDTGTQDSLFELYSYYDNVVPFTVTAGTEYWISIVSNARPDVWAWASGTGGDHESYSYGASTLQEPFDLAFTLTSADTPSTVPEPGSLALVGTGMLGMAGVVRRRLVRGQGGLSY